MDNLFWSAEPLPQTRVFSRGLSGNGVPVTGWDPSRVAATMPRRRDRGGSQEITNPSPWAWVLDFWPRAPNSLPVRTRKACLNTAQAPTLNGLAP